MDIPSKSGREGRDNGFRAADSFLRQTTLLLIAILLLGASYCMAQDLRPTETQVEAAYLYNFGKFVTWPADRKRDEFAICVLGRDPFGDVLDQTVADEKIDGKKIQVRRISGVQQASACNILFVSTSEEARLRAILETAERYSVLTVSNIKHFTERGGDIGLVVQQDRVRFEVNRGAAERCGLSLSSELLKVAVRVIGADGK